MVRPAEYSKNIITCLLSSEIALDEMVTAEDFRSPKCSSFENLGLRAEIFHIFKSS